MVIKFSILLGVSTDSQAREDKASLPDQLETCRTAIQQLGGKEIAVYTMDGYSRSGYDGLTEAMNDIPPLKNAVEAAGKGEYDVLIFDHSDRLGDLAKMLHNRFKKIRKQLYSARESGRLQKPESYDPYNDEATDAIINQQGAKQSYRINKIRRGWNIGVNGRIASGLHALRPPFSYKSRTKNEPAELNREIGAMLQHMVAMMLEGITYTDIGEYADTIHPPPNSKKWTVAAVHRTLCNPFYAGIIRFGVMSKRKPTNKSTWKLSKGKHEPLWDEATYYALISEAKRRMEGKRNYAATYPFTGLTVCGVCRAKINKHGKGKYDYLACNKTHEHWVMKYKDALEVLTSAVTSQYQAFQAAPYEPPDLSPLIKKLEGIEALRAKIQEGWEAGIYTKDEATSKMNKLMDDADEVQRKIDQAEDAQREREHWYVHAQESQQTAINLAHAIETEDGATVNRKLSILIKEIVLTKDSIRVVWRE